MKRISLRKKLIFAFLVILLIPALLIGYTSLKVPKIKYSKSDKQAPRKVCVCLIVILPIQLLLEFMISNILPRK